jgi:hypothetical protein
MSRIKKPVAQRIFSMRNLRAAALLRLSQMTLLLVADQAGQKTLMEQAMLRLLRMLPLLGGTGKRPTSADGRLRWEIAR